MTAPVLVGDKAVTRLYFGSAVVAFKTFLRTRPIFALHVKYAAVYRYRDRGFHGARVVCARPLDHTIGLDALAHGLPRP